MTDRQPRPGDALIKKVTDSVSHNDSQSLCLQVRDHDTRSLRSQLLLDACPSSDIGEDDEISYKRAMEPVVGEEPG
jgi:hypothetical protein